MTETQLETFPPRDEHIELAVNGVHKKNFPNLQLRLPLDTHGGVTGTLDTTVLSSASFRWDGQDSWLTFQSGDKLNLESATKRPLVLSPFHET